ncbi:MAG: N-acetylneuraminate synthase family protein [Pseudomonadota bacterium]
MITAAAGCGVDAVKLQKRCIAKWATEKPELYNAPHSVPKNSFGRTYRRHREALELSLSQHKELKEHCEAMRIGYSASVWDLQSAQEIAGLKPEWIKIPSACNLDWEIYDYLFREYSGGLHVSVGMTTRQEEKKIFDYFGAAGQMHRLVLYHCTSGYPIKPSEVCLLNIKRLQMYGVSVGYSGHHLGIALDDVAVAYGATWLERHFTLDKSWKGTDHVASLDPPDLMRLVQNINAIREATTEKPSDLLPVEVEQRRKLKREVIPKSEEPILCKV